MNDPAKPQPPPEWKGLATGTLLLGAFVIGLLRVGGLIADSAVNVLYADQWDFLSPLFNGEGPGAAFLQQHGPHRQGLGGALQWALYSATGWDVRAEAWCALIALTLAALAATVLAVRLRGHLSPLHSLLPLVILSPLHWETLLFTTNIAHSILPLCLLLLLAGALLIRSDMWRTSSIALLGVSAVFTGFGFCVALACWVVLAATLTRPHGVALRRSNLIALCVITTGLGLFFVGYRWDPAIPGWTFPVPDWWNYGTFVAYMTSTLLGLREKSALAVGVGGGVFVSLFVVFSLSLLRLLRAKDTGRSAVIALLTGTSLAYAGLTAYGRLPANIEAAFMWRYTTLMMPAVIGLILFLDAQLTPTTSRWTRLSATTGMLALGFAIVLNLTPERIAPVVATGKHRWIAAYQATGDADQANALSDFWVYPTPSNPPRIIERLRWLEERRFSFFAESEISSTP